MVRTQSGAAPRALRPSAFAPASPHAGHFPAGSGPRPPVRSHSRRLVVLRRSGRRPRPSAGPAGGRMRGRCSPAEQPVRQHLTYSSACSSSAGSKMPSSLGVSPISVVGLAYKKGPVSTPTGHARSSTRDRVAASRTAALPFGHALGRSSGIWSYPRGPPARPRKSPAARARNPRPPRSGPRPVSRGAAQAAAPPAPPWPSPWRSPVAAGRVPQHMLQFATEPSRVQVGMDSSRASAIWAILTMSALLANASSINRRRRREPRRRRYSPRGPSLDDATFRGAYHERKAPRPTKLGSSRPGHCPLAKLESYQRAGPRQSGYTRSMAWNSGPWTKWAQQDSNLRPADYESAALTN